MNVINNSNFLLLFIVCYIFGQLNMSKGQARNVFSKEDCNKSVQIENGIKCFPNFHVYHYNSATKQCEGATYDHCNATLNNFGSKSSCEKIAIPICTGSNPHLVEEKYSSDV